MMETGDHKVETPATESATPVASADTAEMERLQAEVAELKDRLLRRQADFDNLRRRAERERAELLEFGGMETVKQLLPALDDLDRALTMSAQLQPEIAQTDLYKGMALVQQKLLDALAKAGMEPIAAAGLAFDPHLHEAVDRAETDEVEDQTVLAEYQRGFKFRGKLLRPAMVKVAVKP